MDTRGAFNQAELAAKTHITQATMSLQVLPASPARELLETVAHHVISRQS
jgi:geranylgeranyl pyrophosphate synthase